jgi:hypothetical protein
MKELTAYEKECRRIMDEYPEEIKKVFSYKMCELEYDFLGFLDGYKRLQKSIPKDFTVIDLGCNQAVQAVYFKDHAGYIGVDSAIPTDIRFNVLRGTFVQDTIQNFIAETLPTLGLDFNKVFAICSYVPDEEARALTAKTFPYHSVIYCDEVLSEKLPLGLDFYNCLRAIDVLIKGNVLMKDPNRENNILVYHSAFGGNPEGWYSENIHHAARALSKDAEGQRVILNTIKERRLPFEVQEPFWKDKKKSEMERN